MTMQAEYVIWGKPKGKTDPLDDVPLYTEAESMEQAERVMTILERDHGRPQAAGGEIGGSAAMTATDQIRRTA